MFNPAKLDVGQWADAAVSAHARYGLLITRHHDGFALWPSSVGNFSVKNIPWRGGKGDVVKEYVDAFRSRGLLPGQPRSPWAPSGSGRERSARDTDPDPGHVASNAVADRVQRRCRAEPYGTFGARRASR